MSNKTELLNFKGLSLVGGHPSIDLLNTVKYRGRSAPQDSFGCINDVICWAFLAGLVDKPEADFLHGLAEDGQDKANTVYHDICEFRENLRLVMASETFSGEAVTAVENTIEALRISATIVANTHRLNRYIPIHNLADLKHRIVHSAAKMMEIHPTPKIGACAADDCDWLFIDNSKSKRRRWCDTKTCGNRARVRQFRAQGN